MWGLPQAGILVSKRLQQRLAPFGYHECLNMQGLWYHKILPILFTLVVDDFGVKYINKDDIKHLISSLKKTYKLMEDWIGDLYCGVALK